MDYVVWVVAIVVMGALYERALDRNRLLSIIARELKELNSGTRGRVDDAQ